MLGRETKSERASCHGHPVSKNRRGGLGYNAAVGSSAVLDPLVVSDVPEIRRVKWDQLKTVSNKCLDLVIVGANTTKDIC